MGRPKGSKNKCKFSEEDKDEIVRLYKEERTPLYKLQKIFKSSNPVLKRVLEERGVEIRSFRDSKRLYPLNEDYFEKIDSKDKAYWLGWMYADGFITEGANGQFIFGITLAEIEPLILFKRYLETDKPIGESINSGFKTGSVLYSLAISSKKVYSDLISHGIVKNKTFKIKFPELEKELIPHFIRGYFDGDGTVFTSSQKHLLYLHSGFSGTQSFLSAILKNLNFTKNETSNLYKDKRKTTDCWNIRFNIEKSILLYKYLYKDCGDLFLKRKRDVFENYIIDKGSTTIIASPIL